MSLIAVPVDQVDATRPTPALAPDRHQVELHERDGVVTLRCDGWELMSSRAHHSEQALAALACQHLPPAAAILIGGLGLGYTLRAVLDGAPHDARIMVAELLPEVIAWNRGRLADLAGHPLDDPRVSVACTDINAVFRTMPAGSFDAILLDVDNGPEAVLFAGNAVLYAADGLHRVRRTLRAGGALAVWSADRAPRFEHALTQAGFIWAAHDVPARGGPNDPLHTIYLGRAPA